MYIHFLQLEQDTLIQDNLVQTVNKDAFNSYCIGFLQQCHTEVERALQDSTFNRYGIFTDLLLNYYKRELEREIKLRFSTNEEGRTE